jgi:ubiquinone/menaquinone biosynthesis C-methylase UbiE
LKAIDYHLQELAIALDENDARRVLPQVLASDRAILDVGCGIGQSLLALGGGDSLRVGVDVDEESVRFGAARHGKGIVFVVADARQLPLPSATFDLVFSRVSLPYTDVPKTLREMRRVLRPGGRVWLTLHGRSVVLGYMAEALRARQPKRLLHATYTLMNGYLLKHFGVVIPFITGRYESWQHPQAICKLLRREGLEVEVQLKGRHTVVEGQLV